MKRIFWKWRTEVHLKKYESGQIKEAGLYRMIKDYQPRIFAVNKSGAPEKMLNAFSAMRSNMKEAMSGPPYFTMAVPRLLQTKWKIGVWKKKAYSEFSIRWFFLELDGRFRWSVRLNSIIVLSIRIRAKL